MRLVSTRPALAALCAAAGLVGLVHARPEPGAPPASAHAHGEDAPILIRAQRVIVRPGEVLEGVSVLVRDGRVAAVGQDLAAPEGATVVEGDTVSAAFVDLWSALGVSSSAMEEQGASAATRTADGYDRHGGEHLREEALRAGVTTARVQAARSGSVCGLGAFVRFAPAHSPEECVLRDDAGLAMSVGLSRESSGQFVMLDDGNWVFQQGSQAMDPFDRLDQIERVASALESGRGYLEEQIEYRYELEEWEKAIAEKEAELEKEFKKAKKDREKEQKEAEEKDKEFKEKKYKEDRRPREPKFDEDKEVLARVVNGELPLVVEVHRAAELRYLLELTGKYDRLRLIVAGGSEATACAEQLAERRVPVLVWPSLRGTSFDDEFQGPGLSLAGELHAAGVPVLLGSGGRDGAATRDLPLLAAVAIGHGLDAQAAHAALTEEAARALDLSQHLGTVEAGKDAELIVTDGDPLATTSRITHVISGGRLVSGPNN